MIKLGTWHIYTDYWRLWPRIQTANTGQFTVLEIGVGPLRFRRVKRRKT